MKPVAQNYLFIAILCAKYLVCISPNCDFSDSKNELGSKKIALYRSTITMLNNFTFLQNISLFCKITALSFSSSIQKSYNEEKLLFNNSKREKKERT
jgi:hypothetical protein